MSFEIRQTDVKYMSTCVLSFVPSQTLWRRQATDPQHFYTDFSLFIFASSFADYRFFGQNLVNGLILPLGYQSCLIAIAMQPPC